MRQSKPRFTKADFANTQLPCVRNRQPIPWPYPTTEEETPYVPPVLSEQRSVGPTLLWIGAASTLTAFVVELLKDTPLWLRITIGISSTTVIAAGVMWFFRRKS